MAKKSANSKNFKIAQDLNAKTKRFGLLSIISLIIAIVCVIFYSYLETSGFITIDTLNIGMAINVIFLILAGTVGVCTYQWSKNSRALKAHLEKSGISKREL